MIPTLLWRCPLCATNDALVHVARRFRSDLVRCRCCHAEWRVRRVPGDNFYLKLVDDERSITDWYDAMKVTVRLIPVQDAELTSRLCPLIGSEQGSKQMLSPGESLYLSSGPVELHAEETDPLFFPISQTPDATRIDKRDVRGKRVGQGRIFLTNQRLIWQGNGAPRSFPLNRVNSGYAVVDFGLAVMVEMRLYVLRFLEESPLKWVTYLALVARQVKAETGHRITTSHF